jgi:hypothetical protein
MARKAEILLDYQNLIEHPPVQPEAMWNTACSNDGPTINAWRDQWAKQVRENREKFGPFRNHSVGKLWGTEALKPVIIAGSGPSLKVNGQRLKSRPKGMALVSCLHNFHFMEDHEAAPDYYMTLDAGEVTVEEVSEGGTKSPEEYWALTEKRSLIASVFTHPKLLEKWRGKIYFYNCPMNDALVSQVFKDTEAFNTHISSGGNVLGACWYFSKGILGANPIAFVGADFAFGYDRKFHAWDSKYDGNLGNVVKMTDVYGNKVLSWRSYENFKYWFDYAAVKLPGLNINCTEGGTLGAYPEGNIAAINQMELDRFFEMYSMHELTRAQCEDPEIKEVNLLI